MGVLIAGKQLIVVVGNVLKSPVTKEVVLQTIAIVIKRKF